MNALDKFGFALNDYIHLVLPTVLDLYEDRETPLHIKLVLLAFIRRLVLSCSLALFLSSIVPSMCRTLKDQSLPKELKDAALVTLKVLHDVYPLDFRPYVSRIWYDQQLSCVSLTLA